MLLFCYDKKKQGKEQLLGDDILKVILIFGPQAVGKMSIGEKIAEVTELPLFHNHVTLDAIWPYIEWNDTTFELAEQLRFGIFKYISEDAHHKGIIFTFVWSFDNQKDWAYIEKIKSLFSQDDQEVYFIELAADLEERLRRNKTENRLMKKPSKRDIKFSEYELLASVEKDRLNSKPHEIKEERYLKLDTTDLNIEESSQVIIEWLGTFESSKEK